MPVGYHRNVPAASPTGPPDAHRIHGPLGIEVARGLAETSLFRSWAVRRFCFASSRRAISPYVACVEQEPAVGRLRSRSHNDDRVKAEAAAVAVSAKMSISTRRKEYVQGHSPGAL